MMTPPHPSAPTRCCRPPALALSVALALALAPSLVAPPGLDAQQPDWDAVELQVQEVGDGVHMIVGRGGNLGLSVGADGAFLVDDQYAPLTDKIKAAVADAGGGEVRFVVNTHWHGDHTGGNENLGEEGAMIVAHANVRKRMNPEEFGQVMGRSEQAPPAALPVITFSDTLTFHWNGEEIRVFHVHDAHTDGDALIHFVGADVIHMGDTYFNQMYPFIDVESGGSVHGMIRAAERALAVSDSDTRIIPGHGPLSNREELAEYRNMLVTIRDRVQRMINEGMSEDEVVAARPSAEWDEELGGGFIDPERLARLVYQGMIRD